MTKPSFEVSPDVRKLADYLRERSRASYEEIGRHVGRKVNGHERHILYGALRILQRDAGIVFVTVRGLGIARATDSQIAALGTDHVIRRTQRTVRRGRKLHPIVDIQRLSAEEREMFWVGRAVTQALDAAVGRKLRKQIVDEIKDRGEGPDVKNVIALFSRRAH